MTHERQLQSIPDEELLRRLLELLQTSRHTEAELVAHIGEVDARRLYAREASPSMFAYCRDVLHLSEGEAYLRIAVARAARQHPMLLEMLADGRLHLTAIGKLAPHLTRENRERLLRRAAHKSKRQIEEMVAELAPQPDVPGTTRKLPQPRQTQLRPDPVARSVAPAAARPAVMPLAPARFKVQFTASAELHAKLERLQALMRSSASDGDLAAVIDAAVTEKLERLESRRFATTKAPRKGLSETETSPSSRHVPAAVRRAVYKRDGGQCFFVDAHGRRCPERDDLEFHHHQRAFGRGGDHSVKNLRLACSTHNAYLAEREYGAGAMERHRRGAKTGGAPVAAVVT